MNSDRLFTEESAKDILFAETPANILTAYNTPYKLPEKLVQNYNKNGFVEIPDLLIGEALIYAEKVITAAVFLRKDHDKRKLAEKSQYEQSFMQCGFLCFDFPAVKDFVFSKRFAGVARELMKVDGARLWHDQALYKQPGGRQTDVHQDSGYWPVNFPELTTTMWMAMNDVPLEKGCLYFYPGTHKTGIREYVDIFKNPHHPEALNPEDKVFVPLKRGSATFHSGLTFHGAGPNRTADMREAMTIIYVNDGNTFTTHDERNATHKSCSGLENGNKIDTEYTPVLS